MASFEAAVARQQASAFVGWWRAHGLPPADLEALWTYASERAGELGIEDDGNRGISLYAAAFALLGELSAPEFIEVSDLLFDPADDARRLAHIRALADARRAQH